MNLILDYIRALMIFDQNHSGAKRVSIRSGFYNWREIIWQQKEHLTSVKLKTES